MFHSPGQESMEWDTFSGLAQRFTLQQRAIH